MLSTAGTTITTSVGLVWDLITSNPLLAFFLGTSIVGIGFEFFVKAKNVAK